MNRGPQYKMRESGAIGTGEYRPQYLQFCHMTDVLSSNRFLPPEETGPNPSIFGSEPPLLDTAQRAESHQRADPKNHGGYP